MHSRGHEELYTTLLDITFRIKDALAEGDPASLECLAAEHRKVMAELQLLGACRDAGLEHLLQRVQDEVNCLYPNLEKHYNEACSALASLVQRKRQVKKYLNTAHLTTPPREGTA